MNKSSIEWTEFTSNPIRGKCLHACPYCYAERIRQRFKQPEQLSWHPDELAQIEKRKKPSVIFMGSMYDLFGAWVHKNYIHWILDTAKNCPQHTFLFLTKNPSRYAEFAFTPNCFLGATITDQISALEHISEGLHFASIEPLMGPIYPSMIHTDIPALILGAQTGPGAVLPEREWIDTIIQQAGDRPLFLKNNLLSLFPDLPRRQDLPWKVNK